MIGALSDDRLIEWAKLLTGTHADSTVEVGYKAESVIWAGRLARLAGIAERRMAAESERALLEVKLTCERRRTEAIKEAARALLAFDDYYCVTEDARDALEALL